MVIRHEVLDRLAREQLGHVTLRQALDAGVSRSTVQRLRRSGRLVAVGATTYRLASAAVGPRSAVMAACLDLDATASHWTGGWMRGLLPARPWVDVTVPKGRSTGGKRQRASAEVELRVHTSTNLPTSDVLLDGPIPVTSVARTLLDLAALVPADLSSMDLREVVDAAVDRGLASDPWLWWLLAERRCRGRNGVACFEEALAARSGLGPTESWLEREVLRILAAGGVRLPVTQRVVRRNGRFAARVDFLYEPERIVLEALGYGYHRTPAQMEADTRRANELQLLGFEVYQFTTRQVTGSPGSVVATAAGALARSEARRGHP
jgi:very-short-patch-repair endonuclease